MDDELRLLHSAQAGDMERLRAQAMRLANEKRQLEQVVKEALDLLPVQVKAYYNTLSNPEWRAEVEARRAWRTRAKALLEQEVK